MTQRTFYVEGRKIVIKTRPLTYLGNLRGFRVDINGTKYTLNGMLAEDAEAAAYARWVRDHA